MKNREEYLPLFVTISALLYLLEGAIPKPFPWFKLGLSNVITIIAIYYFDFKFIIKLVFFRVITGALITATLFTPTFFLSLSGGIFSAIGMFLFYNFFRNNISTIGISLIGAEIHIITQLFIVYLFIIKDKSIFSLLPVLMSISFFTGIVIGYISYKVVNKLTILHFPFR